MAKMTLLRSIFPGRVDALWRPACAEVALLGGRVYEYRDHAYDGRDVDVSVQSRWIGAGWTCLRRLYSVQRYTRL